jgi:hypothetical protein
VNDIQADNTKPTGTLQVMVKDQYGTKAYHPINDTAFTFAKIAGTKTLTLATLKYALSLGYEIAYQHQPVELPQ